MTTVRIIRTLDRKDDTVKVIGNIRQRAHRRAQGPGRLAALLLGLLVVLGLPGGTAFAAAGGAHPARPAVRVPAAAMDAVAASRPHAVPR
ncbi:hypothetical protein D9753_03255 [Streptomyces dangxiongensis]|uniref:Uncharacterized protein n=1 Tax=Streptomyces dangxiongensis TaxID=1442032 RepID=A0A3G2J7A0_9ACTN|nr:hypothetical protein [Streptomyces dangxiongensis]AYN38120.1 hypothetical protein D9753_03255 [Streptomyces dangxiongensis]